MSRLHSRAVLDVVLILGATAVTVGLLANPIADRLRERSVKQFAQRLIDPVRVPADGVGYVVYLVLNSQCPYCTASMPFYRTLLGTANNTRIVVTGPEAPEVLSAYCATHGFMPHHVVAARETASLPTPTLILTDPAGTVLRVLRGQLNEQRSSEITATLTAK